MTTKSKKTRGVPISTERLDAVLKWLRLDAAGEPKSDARNNDKLVADLAAHADKSAYYYCVLVYVRHADDPQPVIADGVWRGRIIDTPRGANGFGYDPYFLVPEFDRTAAELAPQEKNAVSHRGQALRALVDKLGKLK